MRLTEVTLDEVRELQPLVVAHLDALEAGLRSVTGQLPVGPAGRPDVLAVDSEGALIVIELKAVEANADALVQLCRYYDWLSQNIALVARPFPEFRPDQGVRSMLVAPGFSSEALVLARYLQESLSLSLFHCQALRDSDSKRLGIVFREIDISPARTQHPKLRSVEDIVAYITDTQATADFGRVIAELRDVGATMELESGGRYRSAVFNVAADTPVAYLQARQKFFRCWTPVDGDEDWPVYRCATYDDWVRQCRDAIYRHIKNSGENRRT